MNTVYTTGYTMIQSPSSTDDSCQCVALMPVHTISVFWTYYHKALILT